MLKQVFDYHVNRIIGSFVIVLALPSWFEVFLGTIRTFENNFGGYNFQVEAIPANVGVLLMSVAALVACMFMPGWRRSRITSLAWPFVLVPPVLFVGSYYFGILNFIDIENGKLPDCDFTCAWEMLLEK